MSKKREPLITQHGQIERLLRLIDKLESLPLSARAVETMLRVYAEIHRITGLHSTTINHNTRSISISFEGIKPKDPPAIDIEAIPIPELPEQPRELTLPTLEPVRYTLADFPEDPEQDPPEEFQEP
jgi:hypothetical protein